jgi:SAM-dependent methyltransferase
MRCRHCSSPLQDTFLDLGFAPLSNAYLTESDLSSPEPYYPLELKVCRHCWLVQTNIDARAIQVFPSDYAYFSSVSSSWLEHAHRYAQAVIRRLELTGNSLVVEVGCNDGYLLRNFVSAGIPCLGIEPTASTADAAEKLGISVIREFFGQTLAARLARQKKQADLVIGNNVFAHVPDINDFARGLKCALKRGGTITLEFPHLLRLIEQTQFDTVYHEHFSYLSLYTVDRVLASADLRITDVEELSTHGGSLRVYACHSEDRHTDTGALGAILSVERRAGLQDLTVYRQFQARVNALKDVLLTFLITQKREGRRVAAYGAAAKGNTLLNYAGIKRDLLSFVCDAAPSKQRKFLPGSHIPVVPPSALIERKPELVLVLPWNIADEITRQHAYIKDWGGQFFIAVPELQILK